MNVEIAQRLASLRREKGYSQEALATELGLSRQAVSKWERAESQPDTGNLIALADLYGVTLDELVRVEADIADDVRFEETEKDQQKEDEVKAAAMTATIAAKQAAAAAARAETAASHTEAQTSQIPIQQDQASQVSTQQTQNSQTQNSSPSQQAYSQTETSAQTSAGTSFQSGATAPMPPQSQPTKVPRNPWMTFPYPVLVVMLFLLAGFLYGAWNPAWVLFLTIPFYYWIVNVITNDPNYQADREKRFKQ